MEDKLSKEIENLKKSISTDKHELSKDDYRRIIVLLNSGLDTVDNIIERIFSSNMSYDTVKDKVYGVDILDNELECYGCNRKFITVGDYLNCYEQNDKEVISIHNELTGNRIFMGRVDYLNVDRTTGCMSPLSYCIIESFMEPDNLQIRLSAELEGILIEYYKEYGSEVYID